MNDVAMINRVEKNVFAWDNLENLAVFKENLEVLEIREAYKIADLSPLSSFAKLKKLVIVQSSIVDLSPLPSLPNLEELSVGGPGRFSHLNLNPTVKDLSPLPNCKNLKKLGISFNLIEDFSPLSRCSDLEELTISHLANMKDLDLSFLENGFTKLRVLGLKSYRTTIPVDDFSPLIKLKNLEQFECRGIPEDTSLLPLARCSKLKTVVCYRNAKDLDELKKMRPDLVILC